MRVVDEVDAPARCGWSSSSSLRRRPPSSSLSSRTRVGRSTAGANSRTVVVPSSSSAVAVSSRRPAAENSEKRARPRRSGAVIASRTHCSRPAGERRSSGRSPARIAIAAELEVDASRAAAQLATWAFRDRRLGERDAGREGAASHASRRDARNERTWSAGSSSWSAPGTTTSSTSLPAERQRSASASVSSSSGSASPTARSAGGRWPRSALSGERSGSAGSLSPTYAGDHRVEIGEARIAGPTRVARS